MSEAHTATDDYIPFMLISSAKRSTADNWNTSVRRNDIAAWDIGPLFNAVKNDEPNMLLTVYKEYKAIYSKSHDSHFI